jgi:hypothetical protein
LNFSSTARRASDISSAEGHTAGRCAARSIPPAPPRPQPFRTSRHLSFPPPAASSLTRFHWL